MDVIPVVEVPRPGDTLQVVVTEIDDLHQIYVHRGQWSQLNDLMKQMKKHYEVRL